MQLMHCRSWGTCWTVSAARSVVHGVGAGICGFGLSQGKSLFCSCSARTVSTCASRRPMTEMCCNLGVGILCSTAAVERLTLLVIFPSAHRSRRDTCTNRVNQSISKLLSSIEYRVLSLSVFFFLVFGFLHSGPWGSRAINLEFELLLGCIFGQVCVENFKKDNPVIWLDIVSQFESHKISLEEKFRPDRPYQILMRSDFRQHVLKTGHQVIRLLRLCCLPSKFVLFRF